jgi:hypothetical protein
MIWKKSRASRQIHIRVLTYKREFLLLEDLDHAPTTAHNTSTISVTWYTESFAFPRVSLPSNIVYGGIVHEYLAVGLLALSWPTTAVCSSAK